MRSQGARDASPSGAAVRPAREFHARRTVSSRRFALALTPLVSRAQLTPGGRRSSGADTSARFSRGGGSGAGANGLNDLLTVATGAASTPRAPASKKRKHGASRPTPPPLDAETAAIVAAARVANAAAAAARDSRLAGGAKSGGKTGRASGRAGASGRRPAPRAASPRPPAKKARAAPVSQDPFPPVAPRTAPLAPAAADVADEGDGDDAAAPSAVQLRRGWFWSRQVAPFYGDDAGKDALRCADALKAQQQPQPHELAYRTEARAAAALEAAHDSAQDDDDADADVADGALLLAPLGEPFRAVWAALDASGDGVKVPPQRPARPSKKAGDRKASRGSGPRAKAPAHGVAWADAGTAGGADLMMAHLHHQHAQRARLLTPPPPPRPNNADAEALSALLASLCASPCADGAESTPIQHASGAIPPSFRHHAPPLSPFASPAAAAFLAPRGSPGATPAAAPSPTPLAALLAAPYASPGVLSPFARALIAPPPPMAPDALDAWLAGEPDVIDLDDVAHTVALQLMSPSPAMMMAPAPPPPAEEEAPAEPPAPMGDEVGDALRDALAVLAAARRRNVSQVDALRPRVVAAVRSAPPMSSLERQIRGLAADVAARLVATPHEPLMMIPTELRDRRRQPKQPATPPLPSRAAAASAALALDAAAAAARREWLAWLAQEDVQAAERAAPLPLLAPGEKGPWTPQKRVEPAALAARCAALAAALAE
jgi:hypothetical protein